MSGTTLKDTVRDRIQTLAPRLVELSHRIHGHPELAFVEDQARDWSVELLSAAGFTVEEGVCGLPTAFRATSGSGPLRIAFCAEYDALPDVGHACGHNVICAASVGAAIGAAVAADAAGLSVLVLGTPGEELFALRELPSGINGAGKAMLLQAGAFDGVHAAMMCHPAPVDIAVAATRAIVRIRSHFYLVDSGGSPFLLPSRAALLPLDQAVTICQVEANALQVRAPAQTSIHLVESRGCWGLSAHGEKNASVDFAIWGERLDDVEAIAAQLEACAASAAAATGTRVQTDRFLPYAPMRHDAELAASYQANATALGRVFPDLGDLANHIGLATDMGNVSQRIPAIHSLIGIGTPALNHQPEFAAAAGSPSADQAAIEGAITLAWTAIDAAIMPAIRSRLLNRSSP